MSNYVIVTDSCIDLPLELIKKLSLEVIPLTVIISGKEYKNYADERDITFKDFYQLLRNEEVPTTSQLSPIDFMTVYEQILKQGKDILSISFSSALSGTYQSAVVARNELLKEYPDRKIITIDSLCASMGQGLLLTYAAEMQQAGKSLEDVSAWVEGNKQSICHLFTVSDLNHLKRGGRLSAGKAFIGTLIQLKPLLHVDALGKLVPIAKARGRKIAMNQMVDRLVQTITNPANQLIYISHGDCLEDALYVKEQILKQIDVKDVLINYIGPVIGAHSGLGTLALFYIGKERTTN
ncbi:MAG: fatty acid-binding protein DegV [Tenericutes bacterium HGW-Tenericutes-1]|jgi:DegV family protein with EDD domain|nr:MAG: fatty acid-binding protein DegV [Tenericutes bacterium HGW-Tenericutes-1]